MTTAQTDFERTRRKRGHDRDEQRALTALVRRQRKFAGALKAAGEKLAKAPTPAREKSQRIGQHKGWPTRSFVCTWRKAPEPAGLVDYINRQNGKGRGKSDLEAFGGLDAAEFALIAAEREAALREAGIKNRACAMEMYVEFPYEMTRKMRIQAMEEIAAGYTEASTWAIHGCGRGGKEQPHGHLICHTSANGRRPIEGGMALSADRHRIAAIINRVYREHTGGERCPVEFWGGKDAEMDVPGIVGRPPRRRKSRPTYECQIKRNELLAAGKPVPERIRRLAEAGDRHDEMHRVATQKGLFETPLSGKEARIADYGRMQAEIDELKRPFTPPSESQKRMLAIGARKAGVKLPDGWRNRLDGGDLISALKDAERGDMEKFADKIAEAEKRAALRAPILDPIIAQHQAEIARLEQQIAELSGRKGTEPVQPAAQPQQQETDHGHDRRGDGRGRADGRGQPAPVRKPNPRGIAAAPPPWARDRLRDLSQLPVAYFGPGPAMLLQDYVSRNLDHVEAGEHFGLRRPGAGADQDVIAALRGAAQAIDAESVDTAGREIAESTAWERAAESAAETVEDRLAWQKGIAEAIAAGEQAEITAQIEQGAADAGRDEHSLYIQLVADRAGAEIERRRAFDVVLVDVDRAEVSAGIEQTAADASNVIEDRRAWDRATDAAAETLADRLAWQRSINDAEAAAERTAQATAIEREAAQIGVEIMVSVRINLAAALAATEIAERNAWDRSAAEALATAQRAEQCAAIEQAAEMAAAEITARISWDQGCAELSEPGGIPAIQAATAKVLAKLKERADEHRRFAGSACGQESGGRRGAAGPDDHDRRYLGDDQGGGGQEGPGRPECGPGRPGVAVGGGGRSDGRERRDQGAARPDRIPVARTAAAVAPQPVPKAVAQPTKLAPPPAAPRPQERFQVRTAGPTASSVRDTQTHDEIGQAAIVGYINLKDGAAVFRAYCNGAKDTGPLAHLSGCELNASKPDSFGQQLVALAAVPINRGVPEAPVVEPVVRPVAQPAPIKESPPPTKESPAGQLVAEPPRVGKAASVVGRPMFWPQPRAAEGADTTLLVQRRAGKLAEIKGRTDDELLADRAATKAKVSTLLAEGNPAGARGYEQGLAVVESEAKARGLTLEAPPAAPQPQRPRPRDNDRGR